MNPTTHAHTPGPWTVTETDGHTSVIDANGDSACTRTNARLIASAPELLAALRACLAFWDAPRPTFGCSDQRKADLATIQADARAAIAHATQP